MSAILYYLLMKKVSIIIPFFNEESILEKSVQRIHFFCKRNIPYFELIFVDDGSTDHSYEIVSKKIKNLDNVYIARNSRNMGRGMAIRKGIKKSNGDIIGFIDCDLEIKIEYVPQALKKLNDFDIVIASKFQSGSQVDTPIIRKISSKAYNLITQYTLGSRVKDHQAGFKFFRKSIAKYLASTTKENGWLWDTEALYLAQKKSYTIYELPIAIRYGYRKMRGSFFFDFIKLPFVLFSLKRSLDKQ